MLLVRSTTVGRFSLFVCVQESFHREQGMMENLGNSKFKPVPFRAWQEQGAAKLICQPSVDVSFHGKSRRALAEHNCEASALEGIGTWENHQTLALNP